MLSHNRGAALIVAIGVLTFLIATSVVFFQMTRQELQTATNVSNRVRAELLVDGALATGIAFLNADLKAHPSFTSLDSAWKTYFDGSWAVGKPWLWDNGTGASFGGKAIPEVNLEALRSQQIAIETNNQYPPDTVLFESGTRDWLYIPRSGVNAAAYPLFDLADLGPYPFVTTTDTGLLDIDQDGTVDDLAPRAHQVHLWADVDNDGDGYRDSIWLPVAAPVVMDTDRLDNNLNNNILSTDGFDNDGDGVFDEADEGFDEPGEIGLFIYDGGADGRDNDNDGLVDGADNDEDTEFLTIPSPFMNITYNPDGSVLSTDEVPFDWTVAGADSASPRRDTLDNDYSLIVNDPIDARNFVNIAQLVSSLGAITHFYAEPMSEIVGRMAIHIVDESSKINIGAMGALTYKEPTALAGPSVIRSLAEGIGPHEYDTRVLPDIGTTLARRTNQLLNGAPEGDLGLTLYGVATEVPPALAPYTFDVSFPGYGLVDDNADILWLSTNGVDDDGDSAYYQQDGIDNDLDADGAFDEAGEGLKVGVDEGFVAYDYDGDGTAEFAAFEGLDDPMEYARYRPARNEIAESEVPAIDNDDDDVANEIGELGDRVYRTRDQIKLVNGIGPATFETNRNLISVNSTDKNIRTYYSNATTGVLPAYNRAVSGVKLNYNYTSAEDIAKAFQDDRNYGLDLSAESASRSYDYTILPEVIESTFSTPSEFEQAFALGLRREGIGFILPRNTPNGLLGGAAYLNLNYPVLLGEDRELRSMQLAANIKDDGDVNHARTELTTKTSDVLWETLLGDARDISYTVAGLESIRINELMVRPVRRVEAESTVDPFAADYDPNFDPSPYSFMPKFGMEDFYVPPGELLNDGTVIPFPPAPLGRVGPSYIGDRTGILFPDSAPMFVQTTITAVAPDPYRVPYMAEFQFRTTDLINGPAGVPPGRYYLVADTRDENGQPTVDSGDELTYIIKYNLGGAGGILFDARGGIADLLGISVYDFESTNAALTAHPVVGQDADGNPTGLLFFPINDPDPLNPLDPAFYNGYWTVDGTDYADTVYVPPYPDDIRLCVGIWKGTQGLNSGFVINFFDFSQEPDHEWVEIANVAEGGAAIDLGGWELEVGTDATHPNPQGARIFTVPVGTSIAPGGTLLLAVNKYDDAFVDILLGEDPTHPYGLNPPPLFYNNGMGLAGGVGALSVLQEVTAPFFTVDNPFTGVGALADFVDHDGNGVLDTANVLTGDANVVSTPGDPYFADDPNKQWDRIVELIPQGVLLNEGFYPGYGVSSASLTELAEFVLAGGVFPNRPEFDGYDNDGDANAIQRDRIDNDSDGQIDEIVNPLTDGIDNDGDTAIDEADEGVLANGLDDDDDTAIDEPFEDDIVATDGRPEGRDEGRFPRESGLIPVAGGYSDLQVTVNGVPQQYFGLASDPPDWKDFVERRMFPGDEVIVTLYAGTAASGKIADRVTYTQSDVENRAVDDLIDVPADALGVPLLPPLRNDDPLYYSFWPDNSMGFDFYRSLERRHPLYNGDRFGTQNRWQATDGNYDDWAPSTSRIEMGGGDRSLDPLFNHTFSGSPLRMNLSQRLMEDPNGWFNAAEIASSGSPTLASINSWKFNRAKVRNRDYTSPGDLLNLTHFSEIRELRDDTAQGAEEINSPNRDDSTWLQVLAGQIDSVNLPPVLAAAQPRVSIFDSVADIQAIIDSAAMDTLSLTAGQADFHPFSPTPGARPASVPESELVTWASGPPVGWSPIFLVPYGPAPEEFNYEPFFSGPFSVTTSVPVEMRYLLNADALTGSGSPLSDIYTGAGTMSPSDLLARSPIAQRAVMFVSRRAAESDPDVEALFEWDGADGLENGEYDVFVVTTPDLDSLLSDDPAVSRMDASTRALLLSDAALELQESLRRDKEEGLEALAVDLEFFSNREGSNPTVMGYDDAAVRDNADSFGVLRGVAPDTEGVIHYGMVRVESSYLGMRIVNQGAPGRLNRFSRVVLTPRNVVAGRVNVNTAASRRVETYIGDDRSHRLLNPLEGIPGVLLGMDATTLQLEYPQPGDNVSNPSIADVETNVADDQTERFQRAARISQGRPEHKDGRYYEFLSEIVRDPVTGLDTDTLSFQDNTGADLVLRFDLNRERFRRMVNLISTRSDVFEIRVTVQAGYGTDENRDGRVNYRRDDEFVVTSEQKARMVYER